MHIAGLIILDSAYTHAFMKYRDVKWLLHGVTCFLNKSGKVLLETFSEKRKPR